MPKTPAEICERIAEMQSLADQQFAEIAAMVRALAAGTPAPERQEPQRWEYRIERLIHRRKPAELEEYEAEIISLLESGWEPTSIAATTETDECFRVEMFVLRRPRQDAAPVGDAEVLRSQVAAIRKLAAEYADDTREGQPHWPSRSFAQAIYQTLSTAAIAHLDTKGGDE